MRRCRCRCGPNGSSARSRPHGFVRGGAGPARPPRRHRGRPCRPDPPARQRRLRAPGRGTRFTHRGRRGGKAGGESGSGKEDGGAEKQARPRRRSEAARGEPPDRSNPVAAAVAGAVTSLVCQCGPTSTRREAERRPRPFPRPGSCAAPGGAGRGGEGPRGARARAARAPLRG